MKVIRKLLLKYGSAFAALAMMVGNQFKNKSLLVLVQSAKST
ncbi:MAG: hypothetical protein NC235_13310 [Clostridiales bacterium]|nr:hypothetical protein [Clostridiales bacterium]